MTHPAPGRGGVNRGGRSAVPRRSSLGPRRPGFLPDRFAASIKEDGVLSPGDHALVALSGGPDSTVLLHLLLFTPELPSITISAAHFDHRMRPGSAQEQAWVSGLCRAWGVPLHRGRADSVPRSEEEARDFRLRFLRDVKEEGEMDWILTGHHGDDQAETVLFRIARGTGLRGLGGIPFTREPGFYRPLLSFPKHDLLDYADAAGVGFRTDPTNASLRHARNVLRHRILPEMEAMVAPGTREALRRLARLAQENEAAWESLMPRLLDGVVEDETDQIRLVRSRLLAHDPAVQTRLLREVLHRRGIVLNEAGTQAVMEFTRTGVSGGRLDLPGEFLLVREFDHFRIVPRSDPSEDRSLTFHDAAPGGGRMKIGGVEYQVRWGTEQSQGNVWQGVVPVRGLDFPLTLRGWKPGDGILLSFGTKKLKKLFGEAKIPSGARDRVPVLADREGRVLWVAGLATSTLVEEVEGTEVFFFGIRYVDEN